MLWNVVWPITACLAACILISVKRLHHVGRRDPRYPPGPPTLPILGNLHLMPANSLHMQFQKWAQQYGPIYSLILGTRVVIVLSSAQAVRDLLDKKGSIYSSRPSSHITDIATGGMSFPLMAYNKTWRMCHSLFERSLRATDAFLPYFDTESKHLLVSLLDRPAAFRDHIRRFSYAATTSIVLGFRASNENDGDLLELYRGFHELSRLAAQALSVLVDLYPPLQHLPDLLLPVRRRARVMHQAQKKLFLKFWERFIRREHDLERIGSHCIAHEIRKMQETEDISDAFASHICGFLCTAGSDTVSTELIAFVQAMLLFPDVQKEAQMEIDRECSDRLPSLDDELPYIRACIKEVCRWMPNAIIGVPHAVIQADEYMGYHIPKDAVVITNVWTLHGDPDRYPNPRSFDPSRYAEDKTSARESALSPDITARDHFLFGSGRRLCNGMEIAECSLFLGMSRMLWAFNIVKEKDEDGNEDTLDADAFEGGLAAYPREFRAGFQPRSSARVQKIRQEWQLTELYLATSQATA